MLDAMIGNAVDSPNPSPQKAPQWSRLSFNDRHLQPTPSPSPPQIHCCRQLCALLHFRSTIFGNCLAVRILYEEIDYVNEAKNADRFRRDFRNIKWVRVPICSC